VSLVRPRVPGDVDMDGRVTLADAALVARALAGSDALTTEQQVRADVTADGGPPTLEDAAGILRLAGGLG